MSFRIKSRHPSFSFRERRRSSARRSSSTGQKDFEQLQAALKGKGSRLPDGVILILLLAAPLFIFVHHRLLTREYGKLWEWSSLHELTPNWKAFLFVGFHVQLQLLFLWFLPAHEPRVKNGGSAPPLPRNGFEAFVLTCLLYGLASALRIIDGGMVFTHWPSIMVTTSLLYVCVQLYLDLVYNPVCTIETGNTDDWLTRSMDSAEDAFDLTSSVSMISDTARQTSTLSSIFYGTHHDPVLFGIDLKAFITYRLSVTLWAVYNISANFHNASICVHMNPRLLLVSTLQAVYIARRQWFHYLTDNLDNQFNAAGFYRLWGVMVFLPSVYAAPVTITAQECRPQPISLAWSAVIVIAGLFVQYMNSAVDLQRHLFRESDGRIKVSGGKDPFHINARFRRGSGESGTSLLLGSGYWAVIRHPNYVFELLTFLVWTVALGTFSLHAYIPPLLLAIMLYVRMSRDEIRCLNKYGHYWLQHCNRVPYQCIPGVL